MGEYITNFNTTAEFEAVESSLAKPHVSLTKDNMALHYIPVHDYSQDYLTTVALEDGTISFNIGKSMGTEYITSISYSTDNGETWTMVENQDNKEEHLAIDVDVNVGDKVSWKGNAQQTGYIDNDCFSFFSSDCEFDIEGNVMSLLYGDDFKGEETLEYDGQFAYLFNDFDGEKECKVVNARNLVLPATTLAVRCYASMFSWCTSLTTAPELLPATTLAESCYNSMFYGCTSLTTAPKLPATTMTSSCYGHMFIGCTSLTTAPELPATTLAERCYYNMFNGCTSLTTAPELPATTLASYCYQGMFAGCTLLTTAPELPATTLADHCYRNMFRDCTSLTTAPKLPATTLANYCYYQMFAGCTSLMTAPELPATTLANGCYTDMFNGCSKLNYIKAMFTTRPSSTYTSNWVKGVASSGTFVKNSTATWTSSCGLSTYPCNWEVKTA